jgi:hypothetical protein
MTRFFACSDCHERAIFAAKMHTAAPTSHLAPHLREVCAILGAGLVRLSRHSVEELARDAALAADPGEVSLHFFADQSAHANSPPESDA